MSSLSLVERLALCDLMAELGPEAPTLCEGWSTRDMAAHLVLRERQPVASLGLVLPPLAGRTARAQATLASRPYPGLLQLLRYGPPAWSPMGLPRVEAAANTVELFVHHEDVRRAQDGWTPRDLDPRLEATLWRRLGVAGPLLLRRASVGVRLVEPGGRTHRSRPGQLDVTITGRPGELTLYTFGRKAQVVIEGPDAAVARLQDARLGL